MIVYQYEMTRFTDDTSGRINDYCLLTSDEDLSILYRLESKFLLESSDDNRNISMVYCKRIVYQLCWNCSCDKKEVRAKDGQLGLVSYGIVEYMHKQLTSDAMIYWIPIVQEALTSIISTSDSAEIYTVIVVNISYVIRYRNFREGREATHHRTP